MKKLNAVSKKFSTAIERNTFYFYNPVFQEKYESYINSLKETLLVLKNEVETNGLKKEVFEKLLEEKENGLRVLLSLTGFSNEYLKRLITVIRVVDNKELNKLVFKEQWVEKEDLSNVSEWGDDKILRLLKNNSYFRKAIVNIFFEGSTIPYISNTLPLFELKKLSISKLKFEIPAMLDTLVRYKEKGSYSGKAENNPETLIKTLLNEMEIPYESGDLTELVKKAPVAKRTMDFIIPNKENPKVIIECSFVVTTSSSGQGDKAKTENAIAFLIKKHYPRAKFIGFVDGIGWYVRKGDLERIVTAFDDVFTFHKLEIERFQQFLLKEFKR